MDDVEIVRRISELSNEEHELERSHAGGELAVEGQQRMRELEIALDQCWDLLRQRRARREFGQDPDDTAVRDPGTVEGYQQ